MATLRDEVLASLDQIQRHTLELVREVSQAAALATSRDKKGVAPESSMAALMAHHAELVSLMDRAALHEANQARIAPMLAEIRERDARQKAAIARLASLQSELQALVQAGDQLADEAAVAEQEPLLTQDILEYAQRLARYTSAPSSYTLEAQGATLGTSGSAQKADYNPTAARAAGYYDPEIPLMAQELPFPSDRLMRQGILYADASQMVGTAPDVEAQAGVTSPAESTLEETAPPAPLAALDSFAMDDEDAFDLDLNP